MAILTTIRLLGLRLTGPA